jgi:putative peptidoglycan lipid II flippase
VSILKSASTVSFLTLLSRITGMVRELLMASVFGANAMTDAFNVAFRIPNLFRRLFAEGAFSQAFVPVLASTLQEKGPEETQKLIAQVASVLVSVLVLTSVVGVVGAPLLVWLMASGLEKTPPAHEAAVLMTRFMFPYIAFMSLVALAAGVLNTWRRFAIPAMTPVLLNLSMIAAAYWVAPWFVSQGWPGIDAMVVGVMLGGMMQLSVQLWALRRMGLSPQMVWPWQWQAYRFAWSSEGTQRILGLMGPALMGVSVAQLSLLINTQIASHMASGSVSWLSYADRLMEFPTALLGVALGVVLTPQLSSAKAAQELDRYSALLDWGLKWVLLLCTPFALALLLFAKPLVSVLYHYGAFRAQDVEQTALALTGYGVGLMGLVAIKVLAPGFYAAQDTRTPVRIAIGVLVFTQLMNLVLVPTLAQAGLALSIGLGAMLNAACLWYFLNRSGRYTPQAGWPRLVWQVALASAVVGVFLFWCAHHWDWVALKELPLQRVILMAGVLGFCALLYAGVLALLGLKVRALMNPQWSGQSNGV